MMAQFFRTPKLGLFFAVAFLALQGTPAAAADSAGSGAYVRTAKRGKPLSVTFKDVFAFRAETPRKEQVTVVILSELPMDRKAMTAALRKERAVMALKTGPYLDHTAYAQLRIDQNGKIEGFDFDGRGPSVSVGGGKGDLKVNTAKQVEGSFSYHDYEDKMDLRFATDLADVGPGSPVKTIR